MTAIADLPDIRPSLLLDFANSGRVDPRIECTRASSATCWGPDGKLRTVPANVPRIDYDPATGKCLGLLVEEARTNLIASSASYESGVWTKQEVTTVLGAVAPDGTNAASKVVASTVLGAHDLRTSYASTSGAYVFSAFLKAGEVSFVELFMSDGVSGQVTTAINLSTGEFIGRKTGSWTNESSSVAAVGNGWYRVSVGGVQNAGTLLLTRVRLTTEMSASGMTFSGDGSSGVYVWGIQLEQGVFASSYIPTVGAAATRASDRYLLKDQSFRDFYLQNEGTFLSEFQRNTTSTVGYLLMAGNGNAETLGVGFYGENGRISGRVRSGGESASVGSIQINPGESYKAALSYKFSNNQLCVGGGVVQSSPAGTPPNVSVLGIGVSPTGTKALDGYIKKIAYYPSALNADNLQRLTT